MQLRIMLSCKVGVVDFSPKIMTFLLLGGWLGFQYEARFPTAIDDYTNWSTITAPLGISCCACHCCDSWASQLDMITDYLPSLAACIAPSSTMKDRPQKVAFPVRSIPVFQDPCLKCVVSLEIGASGRPPKTRAVGYIVLGVSWTTLTCNSKGDFSCLVYVR